LKLAEFRGEGEHNYDNPLQYYLAQVNSEALDLEVEHLKNISKRVSTSRHFDQRDSANKKFLKTLDGLIAKGMKDLAKKI